MAHQLVATHRRLGIVITTGLAITTVKLSNTFGGDIAPTAACVKDVLVIPGLKTSLNF